MNWMRKRVFVALNLEKSALDAIERLVDELRPKFGGVRFVSRENWHLTVSFLGYQEEADIPCIVEAMKQAAKDFGGQEIAFRKLLYGPPGRTPRMIWLLADSGISRKLSEMKTALEDNLEEAGIHFGREARQFTAHLTLARLNFQNENFGGRARFGDFGSATPLPPIAGDVDIRSVADTLDLMESELKRGGAEYIVLQRIPFTGRL